MSEQLDSAVAAYRAGDVAEARTRALSGLASQPHQVPLLHFLGMMEAREGNVDLARDYLERATVCSPGFGPAWVSLARLLDQSREYAALAAMAVTPSADALGMEFLSFRGRARQEIGDVKGAAADLSELAGHRPDDRPLALASASAAADAELFDQAEESYRRLLRRDPADHHALLGLTGILETLGRAAELEPIFRAAEAADADRPLIAYGEAISLREAGRFAEAGLALEGAVGVLPEGTFQQMRGDLADRSGEEDRAYDAFTAMNAVDSMAAPDSREGVRRYRQELSDQLVALDQPRPANPPPERRAPPVFLVGFPRSGTTLLDTFLMGSHEVRVHEERPFLQVAEEAAGEGWHSTAPDGEAVASMRTAYWRALDRESDDLLRVQVDKNPLACARALLVDALFPDARYLFAMRHPCDIVLSCFFTRFRLNWAMSSFLTLEDAAQTYDQVMRLWMASREKLDLTVHEVRYEQLIADPDTTLRGAAAFMGIKFDPAMLDHRTIARSRGHISSPSYGQVTEPLYRRSIERWRRYRTRMAPVMPLLEPWCRHFGYSIEPEGPIDEISGKSRSNRAK